MYTFNPSIWEVEAGRRFNNKNNHTKKNYQHKNGALKSEVYRVYSIQETSLFSISGDLLGLLWEEFLLTIQPRAG